MVLPADEPIVNSQDKWEWLKTMATRFNLYLLDYFKGTEHIYTANTQTGYTTAETFSLKCETGVQQDSVNKWYYDSKYFNPRYGKAYIRLRLNSMADCFMFVGFKSTLDDPTWNMTESHVGLMLREGVLYLSSANELGAAPDQTREAVSGVDLTSDYIFEIANDTLSTFQLPLIVPYFDTMVWDKLGNTSTYVWQQKAQTAETPPDDQTHYFVFYLTNTVGSNKYATIRQITYGERYVD